jgi:hypothetical protein
VTGGVGGLVLGWPGLPIASHGTGIGQSADRTISVYTSNGTALAERVRVDGTGQATILSTANGKGLLVNDTSSSPNDAIVSITRVNNISSPTATKAGLYVKDHANNYPVQVEDHAGTTLFQVKGDGTATSVKVTSKAVTNTSLPDSTATTVFTLPGQGVWMVTFVMESNSQSAYCLVGRGAINNPAILHQGASGQVTFSLSGDNLQVTQTSGVASTTNTVNILKLN